ncbi:MAG: flavin reductase [Gemmobacter sp.]
MPTDLPLPDTAPVASAEAFKAGMALLAGALTIVTTDGPGGRAGFTATAVCSVTADPPTLLACVNAGSSAAAAFAANEAVAINVLTPAQAEAAQAFGGKTPMDRRFAAGWTSGRHGAPVLAGSLVTFETRVVQRIRMGTHDVMFCRVLDVHAGGAGEPAAAVWWNRAMRALP